MTPSTSDIPNVDDRLLVLPFYLVVDVSQSMSWESTPGQKPPIVAANEALPLVIEGIERSPTLCDVVQIGAMDFSDDARVVLRLSDIRNVNPIPGFDVRGGTSYAAAFRLLGQEIEKDYAQLAADNLRSYRPTVFFVTDGLPTDDEVELTTAFAELTDPSFKRRPNIIPFGVGGATKEQLDRWVFPKPGHKKPMRSFVLKPGVDPADGIIKMAEILRSSVIASAQSVNAEGTTGGLVIDDEDADDDWD